MKLINSSLEARFKQVEESGATVIESRSLLEAALTQQFRVLAFGMFSHTYLKDPQYFNLQTLFDTQGDYFDPVDDYEAFKKKFSVGIVKKEWPVISVDSLNDVEIRIFNGFVNLYDCFEINEQLSRLNSTQRVFIAGVESLAMNEIERIIGASSERNFDSRFIYGRIGNISATYFGQLFDFTEEYAVSPYLDCNIPGFTIEDKTVIRSSVIKKIADNQEGSTFESTWLHTFVHETMHGMSYGFKLGLPFATLFWQTLSMRDITRYLETPHTKKECLLALKYNFEHPIVTSEKDFMKEIGKGIQQKFPNFDELFDHLIKQKEIFVAKRGLKPLYQSVFVKEDSRCEVF